jgi:5-methyltetrahydropteroyltriglutamate--homocysteine methyltransferase
MTENIDRIRTTHVGSLPRPDGLLGLDAVGQRDRDGQLRAAVDAVVHTQLDLGIDVVGDGEYGKISSQSLDFGPWRTYSLGRLAGIEIAKPGQEMPVRRSSPGRLQLTSMTDRRDRAIYPGAYADTSLGAGLRGVCTGPISYVGQTAIAADIQRFSSALSACDLEDGFMTSIGPASATRMLNEYYATDEELLFAAADALREEYTAIIDAGLILQIDDPAIADSFDQINPEPSIEDFTAFTMVRIEALNHALRGLPEERIRFHLCWGSWHGPHSTDVSMRDIVGVMLKVTAGAYSFEAANVRHEHEWRVWSDVKLPDGKVILPGVVSHATNVLEHPELVADRIERFTSLVGRENVIASTDCGLGGRIHPELAWAKLQALVSGARLATHRIW